MRNQMVARSDAEAKAEAQEAGMGERRQVEREAMIDAPPDEVWRALTDDEVLSEWLAPDAEVDAVPGGEVSFAFEDGERRGTVRDVEEERSLAFTWERPGEGESLVEFTLEPAVSGTRLIVIERALPGSGPVAFAGAAWSSRLRAMPMAMAVGLVLVPA